MCLSSDLNPNLRETKYKRNITARLTVNTVLVEVKSLGEERGNGIARSCRDMLFISFCTSPLRTSIRSRMFQHILSSLFHSLLFSVDTRNIAHSLPRKRALVLGGKAVCEEDERFASVQHCSVLYF